MKNITKIDSFILKNCSKETSYLSWVSLNTAEGEKNSLGEDRKNLPKCSKQKQNISKWAVCSQKKVFTKISLPLFPHRISVASKKKKGFHTQVFPNIFQICPNFFQLRGGAVPRSSINLIRNKDSQPFLLTYPEADLTYYFEFRI